MELNPNMLIAPEGFANLGTKIPALSDKLLPSKRICCLGGAIMSPTYFYVNLYQTWNELDGFMKTVQFHYRALHQGIHRLKLSASIPHKNTLLPGLYVVVWYKEEWNRGRIMQRSDETIYVVQLIDFGDILDIEFDNIRYLMRSLTDFPAQAVRCRLLIKNGRAEEWLKKEWTSQQCHDFLAMMYDRGLAIFLTESHIEGGERIWDVRMTILEDKFNTLLGKKFLGPKDIEHALFTKRK